MRASSRSCGALPRDTLFNGSGFRFTRDSHPMDIPTRFYFGFTLFNHAAPYQSSRLSFHSLYRTVINRSLPKVVTIISDKQEALSEMKNSRSLLLATVVLSCVALSACGGSAKREEIAPSAAQPAAKSVPSSASPTATPATKSAVSDRTLSNTALPTSQKSINTNSPGGPPSKVNTNKPGGAPHN
jgi:hypothetical protein